MTLDVATQMQTCERLGLDFSPVDQFSTLGLAIQSLGEQPIYGVRRKPHGKSNGWYIWAGKFSSSESFFSAIHVEHVSELIPIAQKYLALAPGCKFIIDGNGYEDAWFDESLLSP